MVRRGAAALPSPEEKARSVRVMFDTIAGRYDVLNRLFTFGMDVRWRRKAVRALALPGGARVLDLACGTGDFCRELRRTGLSPIGFDFSAGMLAAAATVSPLVRADVLALPVRDAGADGVTCGFALRNVTDLDALFAEIGRVVRPGGRIALLDAAAPTNPLLRAGHFVYFTRIVPLVGGLLSDRAAYAYLPASLSYLPPAAELVAMLRRAGFPDARRRALSGGIAALFTGTRG